MVWAGTQAEQDSAAPGRADVIGGGRGGLPMWVRIRSTGAASAMLRDQAHISAPQFGQVSGMDSNRRASSMLGIDGGVGEAQLQLVTVGLGAMQTDLQLRVAHGLRHLHRLR